MSSQIPPTRFGALPPSSPTTPKKPQSPLFSGHDSGDEFISGKKQQYDEDATNNLQKYMTYTPHISPQELEKFLQQGADPNVRDHNSMAALQKLAFSAHVTPEGLKAVIDAGGDVQAKRSRYGREDNAFDTLQDNPSATEEMLEYLKENGASPAKMTPQTLRSTSQGEMRSFLEEKGASKKRQPTEFEELEAFLKEKGCIAPKDLKQLQPTLENALGLTEPQAKKLAKMADVKDQELDQAGRLPNGNVYLVTDKAPGVPFKSYEDSLKVYYGNPDDVKELKVKEAHRYRGHTEIKTSNGLSFNFPSSTFREEKPVVDRKEIENYVSTQFADAR
jgi:hypothetical protein